METVAIVVRCLETGRPYIISAEGDWYGVSDGAKRLGRIKFFEYVYPTIEANEGTPTGLLDEIAEQVQGNIVVECVPDVIRR